MNDALDRLALALITRCAAAAVLISNTDQQPPVGGIPDVFSGQWVAAPFLTGTVSTQLSSVSLYEWTFGAPTGTFSVSVYGDNNGLPGSPLPGGGLSGPSMPQGAGLQNYTAAQSLLLSPNTQYWIVASSDNASSVDSYSWPSAPNTSYTSAFGWAFFDHYAGTANHGTTWASFGGIGNGFGPQLLAINGVVVPEPSALVLAGLGLLALCAARSRRTSSRPLASGPPAPSLPDGRKRALRGRFW